MPCDSVIINRVDMPKMHPDLLTRGLKALGVTNVRTAGATVYFTLDGSDYVLQNGRLSGRDGQSAEEVGRAADRLKTAYSHQVVQATAARNGWTLKQTGTNSYAVT